MIPYQLIGTVVCVFLGIWAFIIAESEGGRVFIVAAVLVLFLLPRVTHSPTLGFLSSIGKILFGIGCYLYLKWRGVSIR